MAQGLQSTYKELKHAAHLQSVGWAKFDYSLPIRN